MAKKKAAKKKAAKKSAKKGAATAAGRTKAAKKGTKQGVGKKSSAKNAKKAPRGKTAARVGRTKKKAPAKKGAAREAAGKKRPPRLKAHERLEKMTVEIEKQAAGDLVVTESAGGSIRVHHTVHPGAGQTPIPGNTYKDLKELGPGTHEIEVKRSVEVPAAGGKGTR